MPILWLASSLALADVRPLPVHQTRIEATLDPTEHRVHAELSMDYVNRSSHGVDELILHVWPNAFSGRDSDYGRAELQRGETAFHFAPEDERGHLAGLAFQVDGEPVGWRPYEGHSDIVRVQLPQVLRPGEGLRLETPFVVDLPRLWSRLGHAEGHYELAHWYPRPAVLDDCGWHAMTYRSQGEFFGDYGTFDVSLGAPAEFEVLATGKLLSVTLDGSSGEMASRTWHYRAEGVHDFAWFADRRWQTRERAVELPGRSAPITVKIAHWPESEDSWARVLDVAEACLLRFSEWGGDYPYDQLTLLEGELGFGSGMEYPQIAVLKSQFAADLVEVVAAHEIAHNWFQGLVGSNERAHPWLDESFANYWTLRFWQEWSEDGRLILVPWLQERLGILRDLDLTWVAAYLPYAIRAQWGDDQALDRPAEGFEASNYRGVVYGKGALALGLLESRLGREVFDAAMRDYVARWSYRHPEPEDFRSVMERYAEGVDLGWFFDGLLASTEPVDLAVTAVEAGQVTIENRGGLAVPAELAFRDGGGRELGRDWVPPFTGTLTLPAPVGTIRAVLDPDQRVPDIDRSNDTSHRDFRLRFLAGLPNLRDRELFWFPWVDYSARSGISPGVILHSGLLPTHRYGVGALLCADLENGEPAGILTFQRAYPEAWGTRALIARLRALNYRGIRGARVEVNGLLRPPIWPEPRARLSAAASWLRYLDDGLDDLLFPPGRIFSGELALERSDHRSPLWGHDARIGLRLGGQDADFVQLEGRLRGRVHWARRWQSRGRIWGGGFLRRNAVPAQNAIYLSGGIDPALAHGLVFDRSDSNSWTHVLMRQYVVDGPALRAPSLFASREVAWGVNLDQSLFGSYAWLFGDVAGASDVPGGAHATLGLSVEVAGLLGVHVPFYTSWTSQRWPDSAGWIGDRIRFELILDRP